MLPYRDSWLTRIALFVFFVIVVIYGYFEAQGLLFGPRIDVPASVVEVHDPLVSIQGTATHISSLSLNGKDIPVTETGAFDEPYLLAAGYNRIVLDAKDKYGHSTSKVIEIAYTPDAIVPSTATDTAAVLIASSTPAASSTPGQ